MVLVYVAMCVPTCKLYFGITAGSLRRRQNKHISKARRLGSSYFLRALRKYGEINFVWYEVGHISTWEDACEAEQILIQHFGTNQRAIGYNLTAGGDGSVGLPHTTEARRKISERLKAWHASDDPRAQELRAKVSEVRRSSVTSDTTKAKMSLAHMGQVHSQESRAKISAAKRRYSDEEVAEVTGYAKTHGYRSAGREYSIPPKTIRRWCFTPEQLEEDRRKMRARAKLRIPSIHADS